MKALPSRWKALAGSLVTRLLVTSALLLAIGTAVTYWQLRRFLRESITPVLSSQQFALAEYVARDVDRDLADRVHWLEQLAPALGAEMAVRPGLLSAWLAEQNARRPLFTAGLLAAGVDGRVLGETRSNGPPAPPSLNGETSFERARLGRAAIGPPWRPDAGGEPVLPIAVPVRDPTGQVVAVLSGRSRLSARGFLDPQTEGRIGETGGLLVISPLDHLMVASTEPAMLLTATPPEGVNLLHDRAMAGFRGTGTTVNARGVEELSAMVSVPTAGWFVVARLPLREGLAPVARSRSFMLREWVPVMLTALGLIGGGAIWLLRPLRIAAVQADKMARGELPLSPLPTVRADELGQLTGAFNRLLSRLDAHSIELKLQAHHDSLTGLPNRQLLAERLEQALGRARRHGSRAAVLFLDLDGFKQVNDSAGHEAGDEVLRQVATRLAALVRHTDTVARWGGDEFVLLATDIQGDCAEIAGEIAAKCRDAIAQPMQAAGRQYTLGVSIGIASSDGAESAAALLAAADRAMYVVKRGTPPGRNALAPDGLAGTTVGRSVDAGGVDFGPQSALATGRGGLGSSA